MHGCDFDFDLSWPPGIDLKDSNALRLVYLLDLAFLPPAMAEVTGIVSSITGLIQNTVTVINYLKDWCLLKDDPWLVTLQQLFDEFKELLELLNGIKMKLKAGSRASWRICPELNCFKTLILIAGQHDNLALTLAIQKTLGNIKDNVDVLRENADVTRQLQMEEKAKEVAAWITPLDYYAVQHDNLKKCAKDTGGWFFRLQKFLDWVDASIAPSVLWCVGGHEYFRILGFPIDILTSIHSTAGVGKTILASTIANHLHMKFKED
ncbi:hypothetical protein IW261DRAFT_1665072 [Armillaria novae-zelandiae]|uniref:Fungal N-terminal domain-containing protein n=1 Tax=Armillaria novae-zelandiae TaxID=153914 RepID=A0AA39NV47_9AGAR|nr:hypothetical protein IW261DRAFT_1665072 [Armillaria novae-zelandiae]